MTQPSNYAAFVAQAEAAVKDLKDPELKRVAFEKILEDLMRGGESHAEPSTAATKRHAKKGNANAKAGASMGGTISYIRELRGEAFFKKQKTISDVKVELENRGHHIPLTSLSGPLQSLCKSRELRRSRSASGKKTFVYSNW